MAILGYYVFIMVLALITTHLIPLQLPVHYRVIKVLSAGYNFCFLLYFNVCQQSL